MKKNFKNFTKNYLTKLEKLFKEIDLDSLSRLETELENLRKNNLFKIVNVYMLI